MTTWTASNGDRVGSIENFRNSLSSTYSITGVSGDTGGTLTVSHMSLIDNADVSVSVDTGPAGYDTGLLWYISGKTVVVAYTNPADGHTVRVKVWGKR